jgi:ferritin-like metal-binding protein YciE
MPEKTLENMFYEQLKDVYYAERNILKGLKKMSRGAESDSLRKAFDSHREETEGHIERLKQIFELMGKRAAGRTCPAIDGILEEGDEVLESYKGTPALDAGLLAAAQAVEHYEIARYGTLRTWAKLMGLTEATKLLDATLAEESATDEKLTGLADSEVNARAMAA